MKNLAFVFLLIFFQSSAQTNDFQRKFLLKLDLLEMIVATDLGVESELILSEKWSLTNSAGMNFTPLFKLIPFEFNEIYAEPFHTFDPIRSRSKGVGFFGSIGVRRYLFSTDPSGFFIENELKYKKWSIYEYQYSSNSRIVSVTSTINEIQNNFTIGWKPYPDHTIEWFAGISIVPQFIDREGRMYHVYEQKSYIVNDEIHRVEYRPKLGFRIVF